jgi:hypothetical protein
MGQKSYLKPRYIRRQIQYWRLNMYAVSYNPTSNGGYGTASGIPWLKALLRSIMTISPLVRACISQVTGPLWLRTQVVESGRMIDLGYSDDDYVSWHQWVTVYFLWPPPENVPWTIP